MAPMNTNTIAPRHRHRRFGAVLLSAALISATACSNNSPTDALDTAVATSTTVATAPSTTAITTITTISPTPTVARPTETIDQLVSAESAQVHVRCVGQGDTTVVLIAGFGGDTTGWVKVEPAIATRARVCSYDRPGTGTSGPATSTTTFLTQATELREVLSTIGEPGPYLVVGHSFGGAEAVTFASLFADEVIGVVLIDAPPTTWPAALCAVPDDGSEAAAMVHGTCTDSFLPTGNGEHLDVFTAFAKATDVVTLGSIPMTVISAVVRTLPEGLAASEVVRLTHAWDDGQQQWARLSTVSHVVPVENTGHHIELDHPDIIIDQITSLLPA